MLVDPSGYIWSWAAAGIGAVIGAVVGTVGYLGFNAITGRPITWGGVAGAAAGGAVAGGIAGGFVGAATGDPSALAVVGGGALIGAGSGAAGGFTSSVVSQGIDQGRIDWGQVAVDTGTGAVIGGVTGGALGGGKVLRRLRPGVGSATTNPVTQVGEGIWNWLGPGARVVRNDARGFVILSRDGLRRFRMDFAGPGTPPAHAHLEVWDPTIRDWVDAIPGRHRIPFRGD
jgi:hypothetical protein